MKKLFALLTAFVTLFISVLPAYAAEQETILSSEQILVESGITVVDTITVDSSARSTDKVATRTRSFYDDGTLIAVIAFTTTFRYDGVNVIVVSKSVTQTDTYSGWSYKQDSFTSSGGTVTLTGKLKYLLILNSTPFTMNLTCDANGNISY